VISVELKVFMSGFMTPGHQTMLQYADFASSFFYFHFHLRVFQDRGSRRIHRIKMFMARV